MWVKRPGLFIGVKGADFNAMKKRLSEYTNKVIDINLKEL